MIFLCFFAILIAQAQLRNEDFLNTINFTTLHTSDSENLPNSTKGASTPSIFGYSIEKGSEIFPEYHYPRCSQREENARDWIHLNYQNNSVEMNCENSEKWRYLLGPFEKIKIANPTEIKKKWKVIDYHNSTDSSIKEYHDFAVGSCNAYSRRSFDLVFLKPRFREDVYNRTLERMKELWSGKKPMIMHFLTVDSFSRKHFFRKLTRTVEYLNELNVQGEYAVFDNKVHNVIGTDTSRNQIWVFGKKDRNNVSGSKNVDALGKSAIWNIMRKKGFITFFGSDACNHNVPKVLGRSINVDHSVNLFYCAHYVFGNYRAAKQNASRQRCIGQHMSHAYLMNYTLELTNLYPSTNQWIYTHFAAAHEETGQHAEALDEDLKNYIQEYIQRYGEQYEIIFLLNGDHGMRYGEFMTAAEAVQEHRLPAFFVIAPRSFLSTIEYSYSNLYMNTQRLTTKPDLRKTMISLASLQSNTSFSSPSRFYDLFNEEVPIDRTCEDAEIAPWFCSTYLLKPLDEDLYGDVQHSSNPAFTRLLLTLVDNLLHYMNSQTYTARTLYPNVLCQKLTFDSIESAHIFEIDDDSTILKITFLVGEGYGVRFDSWIYLSRKDGKYLHASFKHDTIPIEPVVYHNQKWLYRVVIR